MTVKIADCAWCGPKPLGTLIHPSGLCNTCQYVTLNPSNRKPL